TSGSSSARRGRAAAPQSLAVPVDLHVLRRAADRDDVDLAVAVQVAADDVFAAHALVIERLLLPLFSGGIEGMEDVHDALLLLSFGDPAESDDGGVDLGAGEIGGPTRVAALVIVDQHLAAPGLVGLLGLDVDRRGVAVPGLDGEDVPFSSGETADLHLAGAVL